MSVYMNGFVSIDEVRRHEAKKSSSAKDGVRIQNVKNRSAELLIFEEIDSIWGIGAKEIIEQLNKLDVDEILVRINSPGGDVFDGFAIYNSLVKHKAKIIVDIEGLAASIASVIAMAGDEIRIAENAMIMIHDPWSGQFGTAEDFRKTADLLDQVGVNIAKIYAEKTGQEFDEVVQMMKDETWFTSDLASELGFVTEVTTRLQIAAKYEPDRLKRFENTPQDYFDLKVDEPKEEPPVVVDRSAFENRLRLLYLGQK